MEWLKQQFAALKDQGHPEHRRVKIALIALFGLAAFLIFSAAPGQTVPRELSPEPMTSEGPVPEEVGAAGTGAFAEGQLDSVLVVHIAGAVVEPGVYRLPLGARVHDAVAMAGGFLKDAAAGSVNLARTLVDGEQVWVLMESEFASVAVTEGGMLATQGLLNLNRADAASLEDLPGIGPTLAARIVDYRNRNGPFGKASDLLEVSGIGEKLFAGLKDLVTT